MPRKTPPDTPADNPMPERTQNPSEAYDEALIFFLRHLAIAWQVQTNAVERVLWFGDGDMCLLPKALNDVAPKIDRKKTVLFGKFGAAIADSDASAGKFSKVLKRRVPRATGSKPVDEDILNAAIALCESAFHMGRAAAFSDMAEGMNTRGKRGQSSKQAITRAKLDADIAKRVALHPNESAASIGRALADAYEMSVEHVTRLVRQYKKQ